MRITILLEQLSRSGHQFDYAGPSDNEIYGVVPFAPSGHFQRELLYLAPAAELSQDHPACKDHASKNGPSILIPGNDEDAKQLLFLLYGWLIDDIRRQEMLSQLARMTAWKHCISSLARQCSRILSSPVLFFTHSLELLCQYPDAGPEDGYLSELIKSIGVWRLSRKEAALHSPSHCLIAQLLYEDEIYYICSPQKCSVPDSIFHAEALRQICGVFDTETHNGKGGEQLEIMLTDLLQRRFVLTEKEWERLISFGWKSREKYYVLTIEHPSFPGDSQLLEKIKAHTESPFCSLGKYWIFFLHSPARLEYTEQSLHKLSQLLKEHGLTATLSTGFFDMADCASAFEQCLACMEFSREHNHQGIYYCGRYQISHLLRVMDPERRINLLRFCSPTILLIYQYDKEHGTNYLGTLFAYICSGLSTKHSASVLNLHVNTLYTRINFLRDEFHIDFNDPHMLYTLRNSIVLLNLYDKDSLAPGMGWPFLEK